MTENQHPSNPKEPYPLYDPISKLVTSLSSVFPKTINCPFSVNIPNLNWSRRELTLLVLTTLLTIYFICKQIEWAKAYLKHFNLYDFLKKFPLVSSRLQKEVESNKKIFKETLEIADPKFFGKMPMRGWKDKNILRRLEELSQKELALKKKGRYSGSVFSTSNSLMELSKQAVSHFLYTNLLFYDTHASSRQIENEVVSMILNLFNPHEKCSGLATTGGSESILLGILAHKRYYARHRGVTKPEVIISETAHAAFYKACEYLDIELKVIPIRMEDYSVKAEDYEKRITKNTICMVVSCPNCAYGGFDPVGEVDKLAGKYKVGMFIDGCMGSILLPFMKKVGCKMPEPIMDFRLNNLTAMTCDPHKYGLSPKGCSVLMFGDKEIQKALYFGMTDWCGYLYATAHIAGSRSSAMLAAAWAHLMHFGKEGYEEITRNIFEATTKLKNSINGIKGLRVIGDPQIGNLACVSTDPNLDIYELGNYLESKDWHMPGVPKYPGLHLTITPANIKELDLLVSLMRKGVQAVRDSPGKYCEGSCKILKMIVDVPSSISRAVLEESYHELYEAKNYYQEEEEKNVNKKKSKRKNKRR